jgi:hypothetical protein
MAGNIVRWVDSFLSDRRAILVIDRRTSETRNIRCHRCCSSYLSARPRFSCSVSAVKVLRAAKDAVVRIGEQTTTIKQGTTKWLGLWLDPKLSFKTHFENRMASAKGALQRVASLSRSNGGLFKSEKQCSRS